ncbi:hydrolase [Schizosaccharomyces cryophilus OY26]|uniref:Hydrolase n=1 Tax=Schizosaccharomyces cryophilus (strain OY26 / ATCC MYA-4695 / CBS 11777 / NBRC 106824 / NRRL Y48691) TaxID=653667 RepID=S9XAD3_SCHCR|nr:hydrolase [Schizosaccharomyces cryophilus OY26]EPY50726.1 hydrolase [Schizosaccharomyces cryophilus OY26]
MPFKPVQLAFEKFSAAAPKKPPVLILHGLLGSRKNWRSLSQNFVSKLDRDVYNIDQRCHGDSPGVGPLSYQSLAFDTQQFMKTHGIEKASIIGHSMGGKTAMATALMYPDMVEKLVVADNSPIYTHLPEKTKVYIKAMMRIDEANFKKQSSADKMLKEVENDTLVRAFLLSNLRKSPENPSIFKSQIPLELIHNSLPDLAGFSVNENGADQYKKPTLVIKAKHSTFVPDEALPVFKKMFPNYKLETLDCGHWVHFEKAKEFTELVVKFLSSD